MAERLREHWGSRLGFVLAALGSAIGLGTLWKFPYVTGEYGGGNFVFFYFLFTFIFGIPLFVGELLLGRRAQRGSVGIFAHLSGNKSAWRGVGWLAVASSFLILSYYCVVAGWGLSYLLMSLNQFYTLRPIDQIAGTFSVLYSSGSISLFWAFVFLAMTLGVVMRGIRQGIEFWSRILTLSLLGLLVLLLLYSMTLEGFSEALRFLFHFDFTNLQLSGILEALGLSFFTLSLAQGIILTYGSYLKEEADLPKMALVVGIMVVLVSFMTVLMIFPVIFTFNLPAQAGEGLVFQTLPVLFAHLPGTLLISTLFFTLFVFTGLTSSIALLEVVVANLIDLYGWSRKKAVVLSSIALFIVGIPSALSGSHKLFKAWLPIYGLNFFQTLDTLVSVWLLPLGGFLTVLYLGWHLKKELVREEFAKGSTLKSLFSIWYFLIRWVLPVGILLIFLQKGGAL